MTGEPRRGAVEVRTGLPNAVGSSWVSVLGVDPPLVCLGVDEPDGSETIHWYAPGNALSAGGLRWRVTRTQPVGRPPRAIPRGAAGRRVVAVLEPIARP
ncbi:hypothetical protein [Jiangella gansuensis]|uniref:hypothetical protein n=1 Tax=Jiangella gansuensis TaxID=281473 RepID=UPI00047C3DE5|nr:hypothetical protein [Jiangella gansuensis]